MSAPRVSRGRLVMKALPEPDFLDYELPPGHIVLMTDDGTDATPALARSLAGRDWKVVVLGFPKEIIPHASRLPSGVERVSLADMSEPELARALTEVDQKYGPVAAFFHMHPPSKAELNGGIHFPESDRAIVRHIFLAARNLKDPLIKSARQGRSLFMVIVRLDGEFGMGSELPFSPISGGLFGLVKTLNQEWEPVFCRALDLNPNLDAGQVVAHVVAEIHDPNRLIAEVAYSLEGRSTLVVEKME